MQERPEPVKFVFWSSGPEMGNALYGSGTAPQPRDPWEEDIIQDIAKKLEELGYPAMNDNAKLQLLRLFQDEKSWSQVDKALFHSDVVATLGTCTVPQPVYLTSSDTENCCTRQPVHFVASL